LIFSSGIKILDDILFKSNVISVMGVHAALNHMGHRPCNGIEPVTGLWCQGVETPKALLMKIEPEPHLPHMHTGFVFLYYLLHNSGIELCLSMVL
jgi:hypothetical protein